MNHWLRAGSVQVYLDSGDRLPPTGVDCAWEATTILALVVCNCPAGLQAATYRYCTSKPSSCNNLTCNLQPAPPAPASASEREREGECESARLPATETQAGSTNPTGRYELRACPLVLPSLSHHACLLHAPSRLVHTLN